MQFGTYSISQLPKIVFSSPIFPLSCYLMFMHGLMVLLETNARAGGTATPSRPHSNTNSRPRGASRGSGALTHAHLSCLWSCGSAPCLEESHFCFPENLSPCLWKGGGEEIVCGNFFVYIYIYLYVCSMFIHVM